MIDINVIKKVKAKNAILITGLPGIGLVGKLCVDHLIKELKAKKIAEIFSDDFPPQVLIEKDTSVRLLNNELYHVKIKKQNIFFLTGDTQATSVAGNHELVYEILDFLEPYNLKSMITLGGIATGQLKKEPNIYGAYTDKKLKSKFKRLGVIFNPKTRFIAGAAGLFIGIGKKNGIPGVCLMGETEGKFIDANTSKFMANIIARFFKTKINTKKLDKKSKEIAEAIENLQKMQAQQKQPEFKKEDTMHYIR